jgi:hypothetical protein
VKNYKSRIVWRILDECWEFVDQITPFYYGALPPTKINCRFQASPPLDVIWPDACE